MQHGVRQAEEAVPARLTVRRPTGEGAEVRGAYLHVLGACRTQEHVEVLVDRRAYDQPAEALVVGRQICATACEADSHGCSCQQHDASSYAAGWQLASSCARA